MPTTQPTSTNVPAMHIDHCPVCHMPGHATETDDLGRHAECPEENESPAERVEAAEYDLTIAKHAWSGRYLKEIDARLEEARRLEKSARINNGDTAGTMIARWAIQTERRKALDYFAAKAELEAAKVAL